MGSPHFKAYEANLRDYCLAQMLDDAIAANHPRRLSLVGPLPYTYDAVAARREASAITPRVTLARRAA